MSAGTTESASSGGSSVVQRSQAQSAGWTPNSSLLWLEMLALSLGALQFAWAPGTVRSPWLGMGALTLLAVTSVLMRTIPTTALGPKAGYLMRAGVLLAYCTLVLAAVDGIRGPLVCMYLIPLTCTALSLGRAATLLASAAAGILLALLAWWMKLDVASISFLAGLAAMLLPAAAASYLIARLVERIADAQDQLQELAGTDTQTGLLNLPAFEKILLREHDKAERLGRAYSLAVIDIDNLKQINETISHDAGTQMIGAVAAAITRSIRTSDIAARLGGDDFIVLLNDTDAGTAAAVCQRIRNNVYGGTLSVGNRLIRASVSLGMVNYPRDHHDAKELMIAADQRMRQDRELRRPIAR